MKQKLLIIANIILFFSISAIANAQNCSSVSCGYGHTVAIKTDGTLWAWGRNADGQSGFGDNKSRRTPTQVGISAEWSSVSCGAYHTVAIKTNGTLWAWGLNDNGQLGLGNAISVNTPIQVGISTDWSYVSCGYGHTAAIKTDGTLWAWGLNDCGELGTGTTTQIHIPMQIGTASNWLSVSCSYEYTVAIKTDGTLWAWGYNGDGELGLQNNLGENSKYTPTQVGTITDWSKVSTGKNSHTVAIRTDGTLWGCGLNSNGELGLGNTIQIDTMTQIGIATDWSSVSCGYGHTLATKTNGTLWAWGLSGNNQLGLNNIIDKWIPTQIGTDSTWSSVTSGAYYSLAIKTDGTLWVWGLNDSGQLGLGHTTQMGIPTRGNIPPIIVLSSPTVTSIIPILGTNTGIINITNLTGTNFVEGCQIKLSKSDQTDIIGTNIVVVSSTQITCVFDLLEKTTGYWDIVVTTGSVNGTLLNGFKIELPVSKEQTVDTQTDSEIVLRTNSADIKINIPANTFNETVNVSITLTTTPDSNIPSVKIVNGTVIEITNDKGYQPSKKITVTITYRDSDIVGFDESKLIIGRYDEINKLWIPLISNGYPDQNKVVAITNHLSKFALMQLVSADYLNNVTVYPNPYKPDDLTYGNTILGTGIVFSGLTVNAKVKIFSTAGELINEFDETDGDGNYIWDTTNQNGKKVSSGIYIYYIKDSIYSSQRSKGKLAIVR
ncbi:MAG: hypothetical protein A2551_01165 [Elusimicrobia bacterium RIFOXYD2_FULL_34_30]|nr:MAG: hypothetical protein A2551_01165 [Elusimicrobia bacterium RIFOXYD2_FULL_34_30]